ncbi:metallophosphoesterase [Pseudoroseicyclus tamaricis]|uniref:Serine/threonine protein phosphatase n=1 Tax=Pseudoroseicyclus tamaricis TaxID=2705421 RepID=A0A6B2JWA8_9RHOB|nr:metallophosphoesterase [Pseudoroseicyclus tamaricis]NDV02568.1 serine/threonine protein phosphatase [Pseudoroseicyclus tamaricis]
MLFAIGDIHGQLAQLEQALARIEAEAGPDARIIFLGDYSDRGPDSKGVLERLSSGLAEGRNWVCLKGNHDRMFHRFVVEGELHDEAIKSGKGWLDRALGGGATLYSYMNPPAIRHPLGGGMEMIASMGVDPVAPDLKAALLEGARAKVPQSHLDFLAARPLWHEEDGCIFVHAGIRPGVPMEDQVEEDLIWIRDGFLEDDTDHGKLIVHGHTALEHATHFGNRLDLDGGAAYGRPLYPAMLGDDGEWTLLTWEGSEPLKPAGSYL